MLAESVLLVLLLLSGWLVQRGGFCMVAGISAALNQQPQRLLLILSVALLSGLVWMPLRAPTLYSPEGRAFWFALAGAMLFGMGAALNHGCFFGTLTKLFSGEGHMWFSLAGIITASLAIPPLQFPDTLPVIGYPLVWLYLALLAVTTGGWLAWHHRNSLQAFLYLLVPGVTFGVLYPSTPGWSLSQLMINCWHWFQHDAVVPAIRLVEFLAFLSGMLAYRLRFGGMAFVRLRPVRAIIHFLAGWVMVVGARLMGGGNDSLLFRKLPSLTPQVLLQLLVMCLSIAATLCLMRRLRRAESHY